MTLITQADLALFQPQSAHPQSHTLQAQSWLSRAFKTAPRTRTASRTLLALLLRILAALKTRTASQALLEPLSRILRRFTNGRLHSLQLSTGTAELSLIIPPTQQLPKKLPPTTPNLLILASAIHALSMAVAAVLTRRPASSSTRTASMTTVSLAI